MIRKIVSSNLQLKYTIKSIQRKFFLKKMKSKNIQQLMDYDAELYFDRHGKKLNWEELRTYSEKMQWEKMFDNDPRKVICSDKLMVREWVKEKIGEEFLIPLIGAWERPEQIDFSALPNQFVLKTNCSSGDVIIVKDKSKLSRKDIKGYCAKLNYYLGMEFGYNTCELHYNKMKPMVIAEAFIESGSTDLQDYKFLCFDGKPHFCWVDVGRYHNHMRNFYDLEWNLQEWHQYNYKIYEGELSVPKNYEKMLELVKILADGFSHVRVDLYNVNGRIYFGEMTFTNASGFEKIEPESADRMLGDLWNIDTSISAL